MSDSSRAAGVASRCSPFRVGGWLAEPAWNRIRRNGEAHKLEPRVMRLLATLAAAPGRPLTRQELLDAVWPDVLVNEEALSRAVSQLRRALGDNPKAPQYVETVHKGGYCLIAPVTAAPAEAAPPSTPASETSNRRWAWPVLSIISAVLVASLLYWGVAHSPRSEALRQLVPLTSEPGREIDPAVSPDGTRVAYLASTDDGYQLFVRPIDGGAPIQLTRDALTKGHPVWSPAGDRIAFVGADGDAAAIYILSLTGGPAAKVVDLASWSFGLDWSPDGRTLAYAGTAQHEPSGIVLLDIASKSRLPVGRSTSSAGDTKPVFSPDGKRLAFFRSDSFERQQIGIVDLYSRGDAQLLSKPVQELRGLDWTPDGEALIYAARSGRRFGLWRVAADGSGGPELLPTEGGDLFNPSVSRDGSIVVEEVEQDRDVWRAEFREGSAVPLIRSTSDDYEPAYAPGGARIAFVSERSGSPQLWIQPHGGEARRLTNLPGSEIRQISWSTDGTQLAFMAQKNGETAIYAIGVGGGEPVRLLQSRQAHIPIGWTFGGDALFLLAPSGRGWRLEELNLSTRERRAIAGLPFRIAAIAADGQSIFAVPAGERKLLQIAAGSRKIAAGGRIIQQIPLPFIDDVVALLPASDAFYLLEESLGTALLHRLDLKTGRTMSIVRLDYFGGGTVSLASDGGAIAYTRARETANDLAWTKL